MADLTRLVTPRSVAVIGASATPGSPGHSATMNVLRRSRLPGSVYLVNPTRTEIDGHPCLSSVDELPQDQVDTALVVVGANSVVSTVEACGRQGVSHAIVPTGGLGEVGEEGRSEERRLKALTEKYGIRLYGPNCPGLTNVHDDVYLTVSPGAAGDTTAGGIGLITQGGALGRNVMQYSERGVGIGCWLSAGNEVDLELSDFVEHLAGDDRITTIACVIEGFRDGERFLSAAELANAAGKPVTAMVLGRSKSGAHAAQSHTAHMATTDRVVRSLLRQHGVAVVDDIDELVEQAALFDRGVRCRDISPCVVSFSGGAAVGAADALELHGIPLAPLAPQTQRRLRTALPTFGTVGNPLDLTMEAMRRFEIVSDTVSALADDPGVNTLVVAVPGDYAQITEQFVERTMAFAGAGRHVIPIWSSPRRGAGCATLEARGLLPFTTMNGAARALARTATYQRWLDRRVDDSGGEREHSGTPTLPTTLPTTPRSSTTPLTEYATKQLLSEYGLAVPAGQLCHSPDAAATAAATLGPPTVMKIQSPRLAHKTEAGGIALGIRSPEEAHARWDALVESAESTGLTARDLDGVLIEQMAPEGTDLIVSVRHDPVFGRISAVGLGGIFTEVLGDIIFLTGRATADDLESMLETLVAYPVITGTRGTHPVNITALANVLDRLHTIVDQEQLDEIEINPMRSVAPDGTLLALDALAVVRATGARP